MGTIRVWTPVLVVLASLVLLVFGVGSASASAAAPAAGWTIDSFAVPTNFSASDNATCLKNVNGLNVPNCDAYTVTATNAGSVPTDGNDVTLTDALPESLTVQRVSLFWSGAGQLAQFVGGLEAGTDLNEAFPSKLGLSEPCSTSVTPVISRVECTLPMLIFSALGEGMGADETLKMVVYVTVNSGASGTLPSKAAVSGGGAGQESMEGSNAISSSPAPFGLSNFGFYISGLDGRSDTQAGDHPYEVTATIGLDNAFRLNPPEGNSFAIATSVQDVKDVVVDLPLGFVGSTLAAPECTLAQLSSESRCPADTIIGHIETEPVGISSVNSPIYNLVPERGVPAEFGYYDTLQDSHVFYSRVVPTPAGYVLQTTNPDIPAVDLTHVTATFYGDPAGKQEELARKEGKTASALPPVPFFTSPTGCSAGPLVATIYMDSWQNPGTYNADGTPDFADGKWVSATSQSPAVTGCDSLQFQAELGAQPTTHEADKPSGMELEVKVPQSETVGVPGTPTVKKIVTVLPEGLTVDPSSADGLAVCSEAQIGWLGGTHLNFSPAPPECPEASKIGSLEAVTPLVPHKLEGEMFLAAQNENPFGSTLAAYVVVNDPITGVLVKVPGELLPDPLTGRLTAVFDEIPSVPFSDLKLHFFGGPRAELATPENCGTYTTSMELFPYSFPDSGPPTIPFDNFLINEACPSGFNPKFKALSTNVQAGAYTPFEASFSRADTDEELAGLTVTLPQGLIGKLAGVALCSDAEIRAAEAGTGGCSEASRVGTVRAGAGPGPNPYFVSGKAYLTGPYNGGPFGLAVVVPAVAGPFNFGTIVVRQSIRIDPRTAQVTTVSDPFPTIIDGIPLRMRRVDVSLDRPQFIFNPSSCEKESFAGNITGSPLGAPRSLSPSGSVGYATLAGAVAPFTAPFQVTDCAGLKFEPKLSVSTAGKASKAHGASLRFKISYPKGAMGAESWLNEVKFVIPKQLPARLSTIQKACLAATFETNRGACPAASIIGHAVVHTEVLAEPLQGPVYFVSYGNAKYPDAVLVLHGDGVTLESHGNTFISKAGVTSATFRAIPDAPVESIEVNIPSGPFGEFGVNLPEKDHFNFCGQRLSMGTFWKAANGLEISRNTPVQVTGCRRAKHASRSKRHGGSAKQRHQRGHGL